MKSLQIFFVAIFCFLTVQSRSQDGILRQPRQTTSQCGLEQGAGRVLNGITVNWWRFPWFVSFIASGTTSPFCGGTLVASNWVLTAAHCFPLSRNVSTVQAWLNYMHLATSECPGGAEPASEYKIDLESATLHPNYETSKGYHDIALIKLKNNVPEGVTVACLPPTNSASSNIWGLSMGYGVTSERGAPPCKFQRVGLQIFTASECGKHSKYNRTIINDKTTFCAGSFAGNIDTCQGDSGGPLVVASNIAANGRPQWVLRGVVSWGFGCGDVNFPGLYTDVAYLMPWVLKTLGNGVIPKENIVKT